MALKVRVRLDFVIEVDGDVLPVINVNDFIEDGVCRMRPKATTIMPNAKINITRSK